LFTRNSDEILIKASVNLLIGFHSREAKLLLGSGRMGHKLFFKIRHMNGGIPPDL
jgi:hypothetical protein